MTDSFDLEKFIESFSAVTETEGSAKKLRAMVLKLGLVGRLGTTDPLDARSPIIAKAKGAQSVTPPHPNWVACGLEDLAEVVMGNSPPGTSYNDRGAGVPLINGPVEFSPGPFGPTRKTKFTTAPSRMCRRGDILVCVRGATTGRTNIAAFDACIGRGVASIRARGYQDYLNYFMWSVGNDLLAAGTGTTFPAISRDHLVDLVVLLPPPAEQKRIVARVNQLIELIDELEAKQTKKREVQTRFRTSALDAVTKAEEAEELASAWNTVSGNFELLLERPVDVEATREAIRGAACTGWLSSRARTKAWGKGNELVDEILQRRTSERLALIKAGERAASLPSDNRWVAPPEVLRPAIPPSWVLCGIEDILACRPNALKAGPFGSALTKAMYVSRGYKVYGQEQVIPGDATVGHYYINEAKYRTLKSCAVSPGDLLISLMGTIGKTLILPQGCEAGIINPRLLKIALHDRVSAEYIKLFLASPQARSFLGGAARGVAMDGLNLGILRSLPIPLPPRAEQEWLVDKVEALMKLCDDLEAKLEVKEATAGKLVEAVVKELVA